MISILKFWHNQALSWIGARGLLDELKETAINKAFSGMIKKNCHAKDPHISCWKAGKRMKGTIDG